MKAMATSYFQLDSSLDLYCDSLIIDVQLLILKKL